MKKDNWDNYSKFKKEVLKIYKKDQELIEKEYQLLYEQRRLEEEQNLQHIHSILKDT